MSSRKSAKKNQKKVAAQQQYEHAVYENLVGGRSPRRSSGASPTNQTLSSTYFLSTASPSQKTLREDSPNAKALQAMITAKQAELDNLQQQLAQSRYRSALKYSATQQTTAESPSSHVRIQTDARASPLALREEPVLEEQVITIQTHKEEVLDDSDENGPRKQFLSFADQHRHEPSPDCHLEAPKQATRHPAQPAYAHPERAEDPKTPPVH